MDSTNAVSGKTAEAAYDDETDDVDLPTPQRPLAARDYLPLQTTGIGQPSSQAATTVRGTLFGSLRSFVGGTAGSSSQRSGDPDGLRRAGRGFRVVASARTSFMNATNLVALRFKNAENKTNSAPEPGSALANASDVDGVAPSPTSLPYVNEDDWNNPAKDSCNDHKADDNGTIIVAANHEKHMRRRKKTVPRRPTSLRRYSARTQQLHAATSMSRVWHLFPPEMQMEVWDMAVGDSSLARVVLLRNKSSNTFCIGGPYNEIPAVASASHQSRAAFTRRYKKLFARIPSGLEAEAIRALLEGRSPLAGLGGLLTIQEPVSTPASASADSDTWLSRYIRPKTLVPGEARNKGLDVQDVLDSHLDKSEQQWVNPDADIVMLEPCCDGCRANHCVRRQFTPRDRAAVRFLVVKDEPTWPAHMDVSPCWVGIAEVFPNVETLYVDINSKRPNAAVRERRAIVRVEEKENHKSLQSRFEEWKKGNGKTKTLSKLEFVAVYPYKAAKKGTRNGDQYPLSRKSGQDDVIIG